MLDVTRYLNKMNIEIKTITPETIVFVDEEKVKEVNIKNLEQYLFICLTDYIKDIK